VAYSLRITLKCFETVEVFEVRIRWEWSGLVSIGPEPRTWNLTVSLPILGQKKVYPCRSLSRLAKTAGNLTKLDRNLTVSLPEKALV
jgi:hypothetical protein